MLTPPFQGSIQLFGIESDDAFTAIDDEGGEPTCAAGLSPSFAEIGAHEASWAGIELLN